MPVYSAWKMLLEIPVNGEANKMTPPPDCEIQNAEIKALTVTPGGTLMVLNVAVVFNGVVKSTVGAFQMNCLPD